MNEGLKQEYEGKLGEEFTSVLFEIWNDWATARTSVNEYRILFRDNDAVTLLKAAGDTFMLLSWK